VEDVIAAVSQTFGLEFPGDFFAKLLVKKGQPSTGRQEVDVKGTLAENGAFSGARAIPRGANKSADLNLRSPDGYHGPVRVPRDFLWRRGRLRKDAKKLSISVSTQNVPRSHRRRRSGVQLIRAYPDIFRHSDPAP
jgi:hypothetical protein